MTGQSKLNNEAIITDNIRKRLNICWASREHMVANNNLIKKVDKNMFCHYTNFDEQYIRMAEQITYGIANGTCIDDNIELYYELQAEGKKPTLVKLTYSNKATNKEAFHIINIIKIDGLTYVMDRSNFSYMCKELGWWFLDREKASVTHKLFTGEFKKNGDQTVIQFSNQTAYIHKLLTKNTLTLAKRKKLSQVEIKQRKFKTQIYNHKGNRIR